MTRNEIVRRFPNATESFIKANLDPDDSGICPNKQQSIKRSPLERTAEGEGPSPSRFEIRFTIYSVRPLDWDNYHVKECQDAIVRSGMLHGDHWSILRGSVNPQKAHSTEEERTVIEIFKE